MTMPKGKKIPGGYASVATLPGANDYKLVAKKCTELGYEMRQSTARNVFLGAIMKVADNLQKSQGIICSKQQLFEIARNPSFQMNIAEILNGE